MKRLKKLLKIIAFVFLTLIFFTGGYYVKAHFAVEERLTHKYAVDIEKLEIPSDSAILAEGERLTAIKGCKDCHDSDLGGKTFTDDPLMGTLAARNLTKGKGGLPADFSTDDWVRALKHGLKKDSTSLLVMPSHKFAKLTENDMKALIAYCSQLPNVDRSFPQPRVGPLTRVLTDLGQIPLFPAEYIDHKAPLAQEIKAEISIPYGKYLSASCTGCHQENLKGGKALAPGQPVPADIS
ncbi:MAG TPA: c-type cytochrome, partial [Cyclobacteriaceae bacterium]|nr:c-type cytochrome [Cyclobacteriaceae bacterium]